MPDVIDLIERDHREAEGLFAEFEASGSSSLAAQICDELERHTAGEEKAVYPVIASVLPGGEKMAGDGEEDHKEARQLIGRIRQTKDRDHVAELAAQLKQAVQHHVQEEETEILPNVRSVFDPARLDQLGEEFQTAKG